MDEVRQSRQAFPPVNDVPFCLAAVEEESWLRLSYNQTFDEARLLLRLPVAYCSPSVEWERLQLAVPQVDEFFRCEELVAEMAECGFVTV